MQILFLSRWFPFPNDNGSKLRIYNLLCGLAERHKVTLLSIADEAQVDTAVPELTTISERIEILSCKPCDSQRWCMRLGFLSMMPRSFIDSEEAVAPIGFVLDVWPLIASAWARIVPLRVVDGTCLNILETMT